MISILLAMSVFKVSAIQKPGPDLEFNIKADTLVLQNDELKVRYLWRSGGLYFLDILSKKSQSSHSVEHLEKDIAFHGLDVSDTDSITFRIFRKSKFEREQLEVKLFSEFDNFHLIRTLRLYDGSPAISHDYSFLVLNKLEIPSPDTGKSKMEMIESNQISSSATERMGNIGLNHQHWSVSVFDFKEATDYHDNPVQEQVIFPFRQIQLVKGNLAVVKSLIEDKSIWLLKESPIGDVQVAYPGFDFSLGLQNISVSNPGVDWTMTGVWQKGYGFSFGLGNGSDYSWHQSLIGYQKAKRNFVIDRDRMHLANTWGDRSKDSRMNEEFILEEIEKASILGISHLQLDDGWQKGLSKNSANKEGMAWDDWEEEDWTPHPDRFPNGFEQIIQASERKNVEICLWFNPSKVGNYAKWERDADILIRYYKDFGIRVFKIDGLELGNRKSEENLRNFFEKVYNATEGNAVFNLDVTAGKRIGYFYFQEYGNVFLENRYTDWGNYFPYRTLKNAHELSRFIPLEKLQLEFLNVERNKLKYSKGDPLSPISSGQKLAYLASILGQPLAWMELSALKDDHVLKEAIREGVHLTQLVNNPTVYPIKTKGNISAFPFLIDGSKNEKYLFLYLFGNALKVSFEIPEFDSNLEMVYSSDENLTPEYTLEGKMFSLNSPKPNMLYVFEIQNQRID